MQKKNELVLHYLYKKNGNLNLLKIIKEFVL